jgi:hypothetical protein
MFSERFEFSEKPILSEGNVAMNSQYRICHPSPAVARLNFTRSYLNQSRDFDKLKSEHSVKLDSVGLSSLYRLKASVKDAVLKVT